MSHFGTLGDTRGRFLKSYLKKVNNAINLSFVSYLLESSCCKYYSRPAKEPEMMLRILILKYLKPTYPDGTWEQFDYDDNGNKIWERGRDGRVTEYRYDALDNYIGILIS